MEKTTVSPTSENVYTEVQHFALLTSAIERETAQLSTDKAALTDQIATLESEKAALAAELATSKSHLDLVEAEKATALASAEVARTEFVDFKAELERSAQMVEKKQSRCAAVKAANPSLEEAFFTEERAERWAEMADEAFAAWIAEMTEVASAVKPAETADSVDSTEQARETAAFSGGNTPTAKGEASVFAQYLGTRRGPKN